MNDYYFFESLGDGKNGIGTFPKMINFEDKENLHRFHIRNMLKKTRKMFSYNGLPDTIPFRYLELLIQTQGFVVVFEYNNNIYISYGGLGGVPDFNYYPTIAIVNNPALNISKTFKINWGYEWESEKNPKTDGVCVVIPNDSLFMGLLPVHSYYASQLVENDLSINCSLINTRLMYLLTADDDDSFQSLKEVIGDLKDGKISAALDKNWLKDGIKSLPFGSGASTNALIQLLEERQYVKGSWWNELGVQSNYNMKRETITSSENILNVDSLLPASDDMLECREKALKLVNETFGTNITVDFSSAWKKIQKEIELKELLQLKDLKEEEGKKSNELDSKDGLNKGDKDNDNKKED